MAQSACGADLLHLAEGRRLARGSVEAFRLSLDRFVPLGDIYLFIGRQQATSHWQPFVPEVESLDQE